MIVHLTGFVTVQGHPDKDRLVLSCVSADDDADKDTIWSACCDRALTKREQECINHQCLKLVVDPELSVDFDDLPENYTFKSDDGIIDLELTSTLFPKPRLVYINESLFLIALAAFIAILTMSLYHDLEMCYEYEHPYGKLGAGTSAVLFVAGIARMP
jgi:hypothetical protein